MDRPQQTWLNFESDAGAQAYYSWQEQRRRALRELGRKIGLPIGRRVEVWLRNDIRLTGTLRLQEEQLFVPDERIPKLQLIVDNVPFTPEELTSCVVID